MVRKMIEAGSLFHLKTPKEQDTIMSDLENMLNIMPKYNWQERPDVYEWVDPVWTRMGVN